MAKIAIFVDGSNMFYAQRDQKWFIDFALVLKYFTKDKELTGAYYFTASPPAGDKNAIKKYRGFKAALIHIGWRVFDKEVSIIQDNKTGQSIMKGNLDIELVFRMITTSENWDEAVLFGVDMDFIPIIEHLQNLGKIITCVGRSQMTSLNLINVTKFINLESIKDMILKR